MEDLFKQAQVKCMNFIKADLEAVSECKSIDDLIRYYYGMAKITTDTFLLLNSFATEPECNAMFFKKVDAICSKSPI